MPDGLNGLRHVYVLNITIFGEYDWASVHTTQDGAVRGWSRRWTKYDVRDAYE